MKRFLENIVLVVFVVTISVAATSVFAQKRYQGNPVKKSNLIRVLKSKQYRAADIVEIIEENGVDFKATPPTEKELAAAGARPSVVLAIKNNFRGSAKSTVVSSEDNSGYQRRLDKAIRQFDAEQDTAGSIETLNSAITLDSSKPRAYQLLGFAYLYGYKDFEEAKRNMRKAIDLGGSAVFRVKHGHDLTFSFSCDGSLYITRNGVKYEGDDNEHTFDVTKGLISNVKTLGGWGKLIRRKGGAFKIVIRDVKNPGDKEKFQFSPLTGKKDETKMIIELIGK